MTIVRRHLDEYASAPNGDTSADLAVVLLHVGGPGSMEDIERFHVDLWSDPLITPGSLIPGATRKKAVAAFAEDSDRLQLGYSRIGARSPAGDVLTAQALALQNRLCGREVMSPPQAGPVRVVVGLRYGQPDIRSAVTAAASTGARLVLGVPMYPLRGAETARICIAEWESACQEGGIASRSRLVDSFHDHPDYRQALLRRIRRELDLIPPKKRDRLMLLFSVLSPPAKAKSGPFLDQVEEMAQFLMKGVGFDEERTELGYENLGGPGRWLEPTIDDVAVEKGQAKIRAMVQVPLSYVTDGFETLHELDIRFYAAAVEAKIRTARRVPTFNTDPAFIGVLAELVLRATPDELSRVISREG